MSLYLIHTFFTNTAYLLKHPYSFTVKFKIFFIYLLLFIFYLPFKFFNLRKICFLGYAVRGFRFVSLFHLFGEVFVRNEYFFSTSKERPVIFDCGSNLGMSVIFFKHLYPNSTIYSFEPDPTTFRMLKRNIKYNRLKGVYLYNVALSDKKELVSFYTKSDSKGSLTMSTKKERGGNKKLEISADKLTNYISTKTIDFLKLDVEGSETEVFSNLNNKDALKQINCMAIEYHHNLPDYKSSLSKFLEILEKNNFKYQIDSNNIPISSRNTFQDIIIYAYKDA